MKSGHEASLMDIKIRGQVTDVREIQRPSRLGKMGHVTVQIILRLRQSRVASRCERNSNDVQQAMLQSTAMTLASDIVGGAEVDER